MNFLTNRCEYNEAHLTEANRIQLGVQNRKKNLIFAGLIGALLLYSLYSWLIARQTNSAFYVLICLLMMVMLVVDTRIRPGRNARLQIPRIQEKNGGLCFESQFREEALVMLNPSGEESSVIPYERLSRAVVSQNLILLFTPERHMILLDRQGFSGGTEADFWRLLEEKQPQIQKKEAAHG